MIANQIRKANLDVFHSPANIVPLGLLKSNRRPKLVTTIHDLAIYRHPEWFPPRQGFSVKYLVPQTINRVDHIITPSLATKRDITELFKVPEEKITVIPHGVDPRFLETEISNFQFPISNQFSNPNLQNKKYILFVGTLEPRKNLVRLIQAYASLPHDILDKYDLVIAGQKGWKYQEVQNAKIKVQNDNPKLKNKIKFIGYYPGDKLPELMRDASVFVYPSLYEGFGLPVLEAMASGTPVVTSKGSAMAEIVTPLPASPIVRREERASLSLQRGGIEGGVERTGILVDPTSPSEIAAAITKLIRDEAYASQISHAAAKRAREFFWQKTAVQTLEVYMGLTPP